MGPSKANASMRGRVGVGRPGRWMSESDKGRRGWGHEERRWQPNVQCHKPCGRGGRQHEWQPDDAQWPLAGSWSLGRVWGASLRK